MCPRVAADRWNGIDIRFNIQGDYSASRSRHILDGNWEAWGEAQDKPTNDRGERGPYDFEHLWRKNGEWSGEVGPDVFKLPVGSLDKLVTKPSCTDILKDTSTESVLRKPKPATPQFMGTADEFAAALPGFVQRVVMAGGLNPQKYEKESAYIIIAARTCAQITPQMAASVTSQGRPPAHLDKLGEQYKVCMGLRHNASFDVKRSNCTIERCLVFNLSAMVPSGLAWDWEYVQGIHVGVFLQEPEGLGGGNSDGVVDATIQPLQPNAGTAIRGDGDLESGGNTAAATPIPQKHPSPTPPAPQPETFVVKLTPIAPSSERVATIVAPDRGLQNYTVFSIDTRDFSQGGVLVIDIHISSDSATDGSFDLFPANVPIPTQGGPIGTLTGRYDVRRGSSTRIEYHFERGQVFAFGLEGNWGSQSGATGLVQFRASVVNGRP